MTVDSFSKSAVHDRLYCYKNVSPKVAQFVGGIGKVSEGAGSFGKRGQQQGGTTGRKRDQLRTQGESESDEGDKSTPEREGNNWIKILE